MLFEYITHISSHMAYCGLIVAPSNMPSRVRWHVVCYAAPQQPEEAADDAEAWPRDRLMRSAWALPKGHDRAKMLTWPLAPMATGSRELRARRGGVTRRRGRRLEGKIMECGVKYGSSSLAALPPSRRPFCCLTGSPSRVRWRRHRRSRHLIVTKTLG
eukprot:COSAG02_NODE_1272_length_13523_cov_3.824866_2_plen_158_part_00